jgi:hypothetical protein
MAGNGKNLRRIYMRLRIFSIMIVLLFCSFAAAQQPGTEDAIPQKYKTTPPAQQTMTDFQPDTLGACSNTFTSGSDNTYLAYCVQPDGNIIYISTPAGHIMNNIDEGYGLCDATAPNTYFDFGDRFGASGNWNAPVQNSKTATAVKITRTTSDGIWTLTQNIIQVASTSSIKVSMTLKNNSTIARTAYLTRYIYTAPDGVLFNNFDGTQNSAFSWNSIGSGTHPFGLMLQNVGTSKFPAYNGFAQNTANPPVPCDYARYWTGGLAANINGSLIMVYTGVLPAGKSKIFTMTYKGI